MDQIWKLVVKYIWIFCLIYFFLIHRIDGLVLDLIDLPRSLALSLLFKHQLDDIKWAYIKFPNSAHKIYFYFIFNIVFVPVLVYVSRREMLIDFLERHCLYENQKLADKKEEHATKKSAFDLVYLPIDFRYICCMHIPLTNPPFFC